MIIVISVLASGCGVENKSDMADAYGENLEDVATKSYEDASAKETTIETTIEKVDNSKDESSEDALDVVGTTDGATEGKSTKDATDNDKTEDTNQNKGDKSDMDSTISSEDFYISEITD